VADLTLLPTSSVPATFDRGHLYSPNLGLARCALDERYVYDYRPVTWSSPCQPHRDGDLAVWRLVEYPSPTPGPWGQMTVRRRRNNAGHWYP
jgi:hypothetical protein